MNPVWLCVLMAGTAIKYKKRTDSKYLFHTSLLTLSRQNCIAGFLLYISQTVAVNFGKISSYMKQLFLGYPSIIYVK